MDLEPESEPQTGDRPMTHGLAAAWSIGATLALQLLGGLTVALRSGAEGDIVNLFACQLGAYLLAVFAILRVHAPLASIRELLGMRWTNAAFLPLGAALAFSVSLPISAVYALIQRRWPVKDDLLPQLLAEASPGKRVAFAVVLVLAGPVIEEVLYRGALFGPLSKRYTATSAMVTTALLFALAHTTAWQAWAPIALLGGVLGWLRATSGSLWPSCVMHAAFNGITFYALVKNPVTANAEPPTLPPLPLVAASVAATALLVFAARELGKRSVLAGRARERDAHT